MVEVRLESTSLIFLKKLDKAVLSSNSIWKLKSLECKTTSVFTISCSWGIILLMYLLSNCYVNFLKLVFTSTFVRENGL